MFLKLKIKHNTKNPKNKMAYNKFQIFLWDSLNVQPTMGPSRKMLSPEIASWLVVLLNLVDGAISILAGKFFILFHSACIGCVWWRLSYFVEYFVEYFL